MNNQYHSSPLLHSWKERVHLPSSSLRSMYESAEVLWRPLVTAMRDGRPTVHHRTVLIPPQLKHVEDGIVHLDKYSQVDRQAGLAVLSCRSACEPGQGIVLFQNKPEHIGGGL